MSQVFDFKPNTECMNCKVLIYKRPWVIKKQGLLTCSRTCYLEYKRRNSQGWCVCENCSKRYRTNPAYLKRTPNNRRYCSVSCMGEHKKKVCHFFLCTNGYYHTAYFGKTNRLHRVIMEQHLGRKLKSKEHVHHIDGNKLNNALSNLTILSHSEHMKLHGHEVTTAKTVLATCRVCGTKKRKPLSYIKYKHGGNTERFLSNYSCQDCHYKLQRGRGVGYNASSEDNKILPRK